MVNLIEIIAGTTKKFLADINANFNNIKQELDNKQDRLSFEQQRTIYSGTTEPNSSIGQNGDIYIQIEK